MWVTFFLSKREETIGWRNPNLRWQIAVGGSWHFKGWKSQLFPVEWTWEKQTTNKNALSICNFQILSDVFSKGKKQLHGEPKQNCPVCLLHPFFYVFSNSTEKRPFVQTGTRIEANRRTVKQKVHVQMTPEWISGRKFSPEKSWCPTVWGLQQSKTGQGWHKSSKLQRACDTLCWCRISPDRVKLE